MILLRYAIYVSLLFAMIAASPARAAIELEPGQWQDTETGTEDGKPIKPEVTTDCVSVEDAKEPLRSLAATKGMAGKCEKLDIKESGNTVSVVMLCGDPKEARVEMSGTYTFIDKRRYTASMKVMFTMAGKTMIADKKVDSKWLGPCKATPGKK